jgi:outer membrane protein insertion porin family
MELRFLVSPNPSATIFLLGFAEAGNNWGNYADYNPYDLKNQLVLGQGSLCLPFGLLGIDWGYGFDGVPSIKSQSGT